MAVLVAVVALAGCTSSPPVARDPEVTAVPSSAQTAPSSSEASGSVTSAPAVYCDTAARGSAGVPGAGSEPLLVVRFYSYWEQNRIFAPWVVLYHDGTVAVAQRRLEVTQRPQDPLRPYLAGRFSECAVQKLVAEFDELAVADIGDPAIWDADEALIERFDQDAGEPTSRIQVVGFRETGLVGGVDQAQARARARVVAWIDRVRSLARGTPLELDRVAVAGHPDTVGASVGTPAVDWSARTPSPPVPGSCDLMTGHAAMQALRSVRASFRRTPHYDFYEAVYTGMFSVGGRDTALDVMLLPPGLDCTCAR